MKELAPEVTPNGVLQCHYVSELSFTLEQADIKIFLACLVVKNYKFGNIKRIRHCSFIYLLSEEVRR